MALYRVEPRPGGVRILDEYEDQVAMVEIPLGSDVRRVLEAAGRRVVRAGSQAAGRVLVRRIDRL
jgi:hypothetical protein